MIRILRKIIFLTLFSGIISCSGTYKIDEADFDIIPYSGKEILVFRSSENEMDTIFLKGYNEYVTNTEQIAFFPDRFQFYNLEAKISDPNYDRYLEGKNLVQLVASSHNETYITFDIFMKGSWFYGDLSFSKTEFDQEPMESLEIGDQVYTDVKVIESDGSYQNRDNYAERFYWSRSEGFLGLDKKDTEWRLIKKYVP